MPMFGVNMSARSLRTRAMGTPARMLSAGVTLGAVASAGTGTTTTAGALRSILGTELAKPAEQITSLVERYGFDGVFLDISAVGKRPRYSVYAGWSSLSDAWSTTPSCWSPEGWYDGLGRRRR